MRSKRLLMLSQLEQNARDAKLARERRYESYLKLKAEFEDEEG